MAYQGHPVLPVLLKKKKFLPAAYSVSEDTIKLLICWAIPLNGKSHMNSNLRL